MLSDCDGGDGGKVREGFRDPVEMENGPPTRRRLDRHSVGSRVNISTHPSNNEYFI